MCRAIIRLLLAVFIAASAVLCGSLSAAAEDNNCAATIVDGSTDHVLADHPEVMEGARRLRAEGADVKIRVEQDFAGDANSYFHTALGACEAWRSPDDSTAPRDKLVIIAVIMTVNGDREHQSVGVRSGPGWGFLDNSEATDIAANTMAPIVGTFHPDAPQTFSAIAAGIEAAESRIDTTIQEEKKTDHILIIVIVVVVIALIVIVCIGLVAASSGGGRGGYRGGSYGGFTGGFVSNGGGGDGGGGGAASC